MARELWTPRLRLRPFSDDDLVAHTHLYGDPEVTRYLRGGPFLGDQVVVRSARAVERFVDHWRTHGFGVWAVIDPSTEALVGQCGLNTLPESDEVEVLYALARSCWGRGLATEAGRAAVQHGFDVAGLTRIVGLAHVENRASRRVLEKLGLRRERDVALDGVPVAYYAISRAGFRPA